MAATTQRARREQRVEGEAARRYEKITRQRLQEYRKDAERLKAFLPNGGDVLEVAPGPGFLAIELARNRNFRVTGVDISKAFLEIARKNAAESGVEVEFREGNASELPFAENSFDLLVCRAAFRIFPEPGRVLREMRRVLRPGGTGVIIDVRRDATMMEIIRYVNGLHLSPWISLLTLWKFRFRLLKRAYTKQEFEKLLAGIAFKNSGVRTMGMEIEAWFEK
jgi:ubiquinone/menaquinone biosynthesis C-methylase UbiE